ncbi:MAG: acyl-CoA thioesterase II [Proteobacteria bacterium]|nr:acyl-CoA thioesterase II [Pseudomonadota bacterium]
MTRALERLLQGLELRELEPDVYQGRAGTPLGRGLFGGHVAAQAFMAAGRSVHDAHPQSLHAYFLRAGDVQQPIRYEVTRSKEGRAFKARTVCAVQGGQEILSMLASFHVDEVGPEHQDSMPLASDPEDLPALAEIAGRAPAHWPAEIVQHLQRPHPIELRFDEPRDPLGSQDRVPRQRVWIRTNGALPADPLLHAAMLVYASDLTLLGAAVRAQGQPLWTRVLRLASLDHALWFHTSPCFDGWVLYDQHSPAAASGRGLALGRMFASNGRLLASVAQEGLLRPRPGFSEMRATD